MRPTLSAFDKAPYGDMFTFIACAGALYNVPAIIAGGRYHIWWDMTIEGTQAKVIGTAIFLFSITVLGRFFLSKSFSKGKLRLVSPYITGYFVCLAISTAISLELLGEGVAVWLYPAGLIVALKMSHSLYKRWVALDRV